MSATDSFERSSRRPATDIVRSTLSQIPTVFGRLVYLSSLRNPGSGTYEHATLSQLLGFEETDRALRSSHRQAFSSWLDSSLEEQKRDLDQYLAGVQTGTGRVITDLDQVAPFRNLIPTSAREVERQLYISDLETLLGQLRLEGLSDFGNP